MPRCDKILLAVCILSLTGCDELKQLKLGQAQVEDTQEKGVLQMARTMRDQGNIAGAASVYQQMLQQPDSPIEAHMELAALYRKTGRVPDAITVLRAAQVKAPSDGRVLGQLAQTLAENGQQQEAVNLYDQLIAMQPKNAMAYNGKAVAFDSSGNHVAAQEIYQKALSLAPGSPAIRNNMAMSMILNGQYDEAIAILEPMSKEKDARPALRHNLALAYGLKGDKAKAMEINLLDMKQEQAQENQRFYENYLRLKKKKKPAELVEEMQPVLPVADTPAAPVVLSGAQETKETADPIIVPMTVQSEPATPAPQPEAIPSAGSTPPKVIRAPEPEKTAKEEIEEEEKPSLPAAPFGKDAVRSFPSGNRR